MHRELPEREEEGGRPAQRDTDYARLRRALSALACWLAGWLAFCMLMKSQSKGCARSARLAAESLLGLRMLRRVSGRTAVAHNLLSALVGCAALQRQLGP